MSKILRKVGIDSVTGLPVNVDIAVASLSDGSEGAGIKASHPIPSSYTGDQSIGTTATAFTWPTGATGLQIKVTHATQDIRVGQGTSSTEAVTNSALAIPIIIGDGIVTVGRMGGSATYYALLGSGATTTCTVTVLG